MHQNRASPFASGFSPQTRVLRGFLQWESVLPGSISRENHRSLVICNRKENRTCWGLDTSSDFARSHENRRRNRRESHDFGALSIGRTRSASPKRGFAKGGLCRHEFMKVCVKRVPLRNGQGHRVSSSFNRGNTEKGQAMKR